MRATTITLILAFFVFSCGPKTPLTDNPGQLNLISSYQVMEEGISYAFFEIHENFKVLSHLQIYYSLQNYYSDTPDPASQWSTLNFATDGVHQHQLNACGDNVLCGSYSWKTDPNKRYIWMRMFYNPSSSQYLESSSSIQYKFSPSVTTYGVFDQFNQQVQIRNEDNFGIPSRLDSKKYGMTRRLLVSTPVRLNVPTATMGRLATLQNSNFLFPADFCTSQLSSQPASVVKDFVGYQSWLPNSYDDSDGSNGVCVNVNYVDKNGNLLVSHPAFARRNPLLNAGHYQYQTPLQTAIKIPIVITYCANAINAAQARDPVFLDYQETIIGSPNAQEDLCFTTTDPTGFRSSLKNILATKLSAAKAASTTSTDFIYVIVLNQNLTSEFQMTQQIIADETMNVISQEDTHSSPRLVGAFVYDSSTDFTPSAAQQQRIIWCPQVQSNNPAKPPPTTPIENCLVQDVTSFNLAFLNFVVSMGPFPTLKGYEDYVSQHSDRGVAKSPDLSFAAVPQNGMTFLETSTQRVSYFDAEQFTLRTQDYARVCWERDTTQLLADLRLRDVTQPATTPGLTVLSMESAWKTGNGRGVFRLGVAWDFAFVGKVTYKSSVLGTAVSLIPFSQSFNSYQLLGDQKWLTNSMDIGNLIQVCTAYCQHPYFDEAGTYQVTVNFNTTTDNGCIKPKYPTPGP